MIVKIRYTGTIQLTQWYMVIFCTVSLLAFGCDDDSGGGSAGEGQTSGTVNSAGTMSGGGSGGGNTSGEINGGETGVASCAADDDCPPGTLCDLDQMACRSSCDRDAECGPAAACMSSFCVDLTACEGGVGGMCGEGTTCDCRGLCVPQQGNPCQGDLQCQVNEYCDPCQGQCLARVTPCGACTESVSCERPSDLCAPVGDRGETHCLRSCTGQGTCDNLGPGYLCQELGAQGTFCIPESGECLGLTECARDAECDPGFFCNERQQCQPSCADDTSCPEGLLCQGLRCGPPCTTDTDCDTESAVCEADGHCKIPGGCQSSRDCLEAETYCNLDSLRCVSGCQVDDDCLDANQECVADRCRPRGCSRNYQCSFGQVCDIESSVCVMAEGRHCESGCNPMMSETSCGTEGQRCLSLQDEDMNPLGDYCFEPCQPEPNACPQGYSCQTIEDANTGSSFSLCLRSCNLNPVSP